MKGYVDSVLIGCDERVCFVCVPTIALYCMCMCMYICVCSMCSMCSGVFCVCCFVVVVYQRDT